MLKAYTEFQKLKTVLIGRSLPSSIANHPSLVNKLTPSTRRLLINLLDETEEDFQHLAKVCEDFGVKVLRPEYTKQSENEDIIISPYLMNPRDDLIVLDDKLVCVNSAITTSVDYLYPLRKYKNKVVRNKKTFNLIPPSIVRLGEDIIIDQQRDMVSNDEKSVQYLKEWLEPLGYNIIYTPTHDFKFKGNISHGDSCFAVLKPGVILTCNEAATYTKNLFKGWDAFQVEPATEMVQKWTSFLLDTKSYLFNDNKYLDKAWNHTITKWFSDWVGYAKETLFDVNCLVLDENHVVVSHYRKEVFDYFKKHKIEPIISPVRHRFFWDGGVHCLSLDIEREGSRERYL